MIDDESPPLPDSAFLEVDPAAYEDLIEDLLLGDRFAEPDRLERVDAFLEDLADRRRRAAGSLAGTGEAVRDLERVAALAEELRSRICDRPADPAGTDDVDAIATRVENGHALVFLVPEASPATLASLSAEGHEIAHTPWGAGVVRDTSARRGMAARLAATIRDLDARVIRLLP